MNYSSYVSQVDESDCGVAALAMILKNFGSICSLAKLRDLARTTKQGTTALGLVKAANEFGLKVEAIQADLDFLIDRNTKFPLIVHVVKNKFLHYYVVFKVDNDYVYIADPDPTVKVTKMTFKEFNKQWSGVCLLFTPLSSYVPQSKGVSGLATTFRVLLNCKTFIFNIVFAATIITLVSIVGSYYLQLIIDFFIPNKANKLLITATLGLILVYVINSFFNYIRSFFLIKLDQKLSAKIGLDYIRHVYKLPMRFFSTRKTGEITSRFNDINKIIDALSSTVISMLLDVGIMMIVGAFLFKINTFLFMITISSLPLFAVIIYFFNQKFAKLDEEQMENNAIVSSSIIEDLKGIETIKALRIEENRYKRVVSEFAKFLQKNLDYSKVNSFQESIKIWLQYSLTTIILFEGAELVINHQISLGELMAYNMLLTFFINPMQNIINLQIKIQEARIANKRLNEILEIDIEQNKGGKIVDNLTGDIQIENMSYSYTYSDNVLKNINLTIKENTKMAIVGLSGSGKSTLAKLLEGFYQPTSGAIKLNNLDIAKLNQQSLRNYVHYLPQTAHLFSGTIKDNLLLGAQSTVSQDLIDQACKQALIYNDIQKLPLKYETKLDEEASIFSGGQKQRLAIARALISPSHVLIFDESTSNLDAITEKNIIENLLKIKDRTIIFIAHRLSIAKKVNNIIVIHDGRIVEEGTHQELLNREKYYYSLCNA